MKKILKGIATACMSVAVCISFAACGGKGADGNFNDPDGSKYSIITKLDLKVDFEGDKASATVKNTFTLFPAEARVQVYLYYSETEADTYAGMTEVATGSTEDLDQGKSLTASWDTKGRGGYFLGRMRYRIDNREWEEKCTDLYVREYTKPVLEPIADDGSLPVFEDVQPVYDWYDLTEKETIFNLNWHMLDATNGYSYFISKYISKYNKTLDKEFYVFNSKTNEFYDTTAPNWVEYEIFKSGDDYFFNNNISLYLKDFGINPPPVPGEITGLGFWNLYLKFVCINIDEGNINGKLKIEFGKSNGQHNFINIYLGDFCIATCYYNSKTQKEISYAFFYNLLVENLIKNADIEIN